MRVLLYADACNPNFTSEPLIAYNTCRSISEHVDEAVVVTQVRNREAISEHGMGGAEVVYLDTEYIARPISRLSLSLRLGTANGTVAQYPVAYAFERELWKRFGPDLRAGRFDILHRIAPVSSALPSPLASWSPVPFVIGPINGGLPYPKGFEETLRKEGEWLRYMRGAYKWLPYVSGTFQNAAAILAAFDHTIATLPRGHEDKIFNFPENGASLGQFGTEGQREWSDQLTFMFVGRLVPFKCADVAIAAFAKSDLLRRHRLLIVGDGPERPNLEAMVADNGLGDCVTFCGWRPQAEVAEMMKAAHAFVFPSIRDSGAGVVIEAMMAGLANVGIDYGPTKDYISDDCGIRIPLGTRGDHTEGFRVAMERLAQEPELCQRMGRASHQRAVENFSWDVRARRIIEIYRWVLKERTDKPPGLLPC